MIIRLGPHLRFKIEANGQIALFLLSLVSLLVFREFFSRINTVARLSQIRKKDFSRVAVPRKEKMLFAEILAPSVVPNATNSD